jgi:hypothetical protein
MAGKDAIIYERHRHRYEVNPEFIEKLEQGGLVFSGRSPDGTLMEIAELPRTVHPFFLGTQFHPEFLARPLDPHPLFTEFMKAAKKRNFDSKKSAPDSIEKSNSVKKSAADPVDESANNSTVESSGDQIRTTSEVVPTANS